MGFQARVEESSPVVGGLQPGQPGNLLERAQQAAFAAFRDGRTIPDAVEMLSKVPEYRQAANSDRFESAREFVVQALREGRRLYREYRQRFPFPIEPVRPQEWEAACQILERYGLERKVADRAKDIVLTARWEDRPEVGFPLRNEDFQVVGATYMDARTVAVGARGIPPATTELHWARER